MKKVLLALIGLFFMMHLSAQQNAAYQVINSNDKIFRIGLPPQWIPKSDKEKNEYLSYTVDAAKTDMIPPEITVTIDAAEGDNIQMLVAKARVQWASAASRNIQIIDSQFVKFNNKEWFQRLYTVKITNRYTAKYRVFETVHNGKFYQVQYRNWDKNFDKYKDEADKSLLSFMFLDKDRTPGTITALPEAESNSILSKLKGNYRYDEKNLGKSYKAIDITNTGDNYTATATEAIIADAIPCYEELTCHLKVLGVEDNYVTFMMDDVADLKEDGKFLLEKQMYKLKLENKSLAGQRFNYFGVKDETVGSFVSLTRTNAETAVASTPATKNAATPAAGNVGVSKPSDLKENQPAWAPFKLDHQVLGASSLEELGRKILTAFKTNNVESYLQCIVEENTDDAKRHFKIVRERLEANGITDWSKLSFSRITYFSSQQKRDSYSGFSIEFEYGANFWGGFSTINYALKQNGKYYLGHSYNDAGVRRK